MKKIIILLAVLFTATNCADFLDSENLTKKDGQNFPATPTEADQLLTGGYSIMIQINDAHPFLTGVVLSDDCFGGGGVNDLRPQSVSYLKSFTENDFSPTWSKYYEGIFRINTLLVAQDKVKWTSENEKNNIIGQAHFIRGLYYYQLAIMFGTVPIVLDPEPQNNPKASPEEMFGLILSDLKSAIELLPAKVQEPSELGRATKWAAEALMARAYLFYDGYYKQNAGADVALRNGGSVSKANVIGWIEDCINNSGHDLVADFRNQWPYSLDIPESTYQYAKNNNLSWLREIGNNKETIFAVKYTSTAGWSSSNSPKSSSQFSLQVGLRGQNQPSFGGGWGMATVNARLWNEWPDNDPRKRGSIIDVTDPEEGMSGFQWGGWEAWHETGYLVKKYMPFNVKKDDKYINYSCVLYGSNPGYMTDPTQDLVLIRFADVLLMHSELTKTVDGINRVRARVHLLPISVYTEDALRSERRYELAFESLRYYDLLRWYGKEAGVVLKQNMTGCIIYNNKEKTTIDEDRGKGYLGKMDQRVRETGGFLQIPNSEVQLSGGILKQNPGWEGSANMF